MFSVKLKKNPESATATFWPTGFSWEIVSGYVFRSVNRIRNRLKPFQINYDVKV